MEYVPVEHNIQSDDPSVEYEPAGHFIHVDELVAPVAIEDVPAEHGVHDVCPVSF